MCFHQIDKRSGYKIQKAKIIISSLQEGWYLNFGHLSGGFFVDNGGEFKYNKME